MEQKWLGKLGYEYKDVHKNIFIDEHKWLDIVKNYKNFLRKIEELKLYMFKFEEKGIMKDKI